MDTQDNSYDENLSNELKDLFHKILGANVILKDNFESNELRAFIQSINILENFAQNENNAYETAGIDLSPLTSPLWYVLEYYLSKIYGVDKTVVIMWYVLDKYDIEGNIKMYEDQEGNQHKIENAEELWKFINLK